MIRHARTRVNSAGGGHSRSDPAFAQRAQRAEAVAMGEPLAGARRANTLEVA